MDLADEIAYNNHDIDDGLSSRMIDGRALGEVELWRVNMEEARQRAGDAPAKVLVYQTIIGIINSQVTDLVDSTLGRIEQARVSSLHDVRAQGTHLASFSPAMERMNNELKAFLRKNLYNHHRVIRMADKAERILRELFNAYVRRPKLLPPRTHSLIEETGEEKYRIICDYIAGMTDRFALNEYKKLFDPFEKV